jgi:hypothetical protein
LQKENFCKKIEFIFENKVERTFLWKGNDKVGARGARAELWQGGRKGSRQPPLARVVV